MDLSKLVSSVREWWSVRSNRGQAAFAVGMLVVLVVLIAGLSRGCGGAATALNDAEQTPSTEPATTTETASGLEEAVPASASETAETAETSATDDEMTVEPLAADSDAAVEYETISTSPRVD